MKPSPRHFISALLLLAPACRVPPASAESTLNAGLTSTSYDYTSTQGVFGPGPDFRGKISNDFEWTLNLELDQVNSISSMLL